MNSKRKKYVLIVGDGMADYPIPKLGYRTPLEVANTPNMDMLASKGKIGRFLSIPDGMEPGSDIANMSILGYDPKIYHTGRAPIEAVSMGVALDPDDVAFRMNLVCLEFKADSIIMKSHSAGEISTEEANELVNFLKDCMSLPDEIRIYPGVAYRHILVWKNGPSVTTIPPHDHLEKDLCWYLSRNNDPVVSLIKSSWKLLKDHPVNKERKRKGLYEANSIWLWGQGKAPKLPSFKERFGISGGIISAVDLIKGLGMLVGLVPIHVEGATGYIDTNYSGKAQKALEFLEKHDFVFIHIEAPDEAGHNADIEGKIYAIERVDQDVVGTIIKGLSSFEDYALLVISDHYTPISKRTHTAEPTPFACAEKSQILRKSNNRVKFCEKEATLSGITYKGDELISTFLKCS